MQKYKEITAWLFSQVPVYQNQGVAAYKPDLKKMENFVRYLGNPHHQFPSIHIAGTNGKGSTAHLISAALQAAGHRVGLYTSPHLVDFSERLRLNGVPANQAFICSFVEQHRDYFIQKELSFFEITVGMAFAYFAAEKVDYAVVEVGLGGRLDATNIIQPVLSVITTIGLDHTEILGNTLPEIAAEKAGIIKEKVPVIIGDRQAETNSVFHQKAKANNAPLFYAEDLSMPSTVTTDLKGSYQSKNLRTAYMAVKHLLGESQSKQWLRGFGAVVKTTGLKGRWQLVGEAPKTVLDVTHNKAGFVYLCEQFKGEQYEKLHLVLGFVAGKDLEGIMNLLPQNAVYYFCAPKISRAVNTEKVLEVATACGRSGRCYDSVETAFNQAQMMANKSDFILVGGSTFVVAEILDGKAL